jgi:hypothetical protein
VNACLKIASPARTCQQFDSRRATADVWSWKDDNDQWIPFDDFNQMVLLQAFDDDRKTAIVEFAGEEN